MKRIAVALFRNDLRLHDNPMLAAASHFANKSNDHQGFVLPFYAFDSRQINLSPLNGISSDHFEPARTWEFNMPRCQNYRAKFLVESVMELKRNLQAKGSDLCIRYGQPEKLVIDLVKSLQGQQGQDKVDIEVFMAGEVTEEEIRVEHNIQTQCKTNIIRGSHTLVHPDDVPFKHCPRVFTSFRKDVEGLGKDFWRDPLPEPTQLPPFFSDAHSFKSHQKEEWMKSIADLSAPFHEGSMVAYQGGEKSGLARLHHYVHQGGAHAPAFTYKQTRNSLSGVDDSTHLSPWLANGTLSPRRIAAEVRKAEAQFGSDTNSYWIIFELLWRDYFKYLFADTGNTLFHLYGFKQETIQNASSKKSKKHNGHQQRGQQKKEAQLDQPLPNWSQNQEIYQKWVEGRTGVPFIDANMRELAATGYMSNRGRQNVCDFLASQLEIDWRWGAEHFEAYLIDHDVCSNTGNWAYGAGVGTDPRNRSFNILKQALDYDSHGDYVKFWLPELRDVPTTYVHHPWTIPQSERSKFQGLQDYPDPLITRGEWKKHLSRAPGAGSKMGRANPSETSSGGPRHH